MIQESLFTPVGPLGKDRLHLRHIGDGEGEPALLVHGSIENGRIFYTTTGKGLAPFLAERGFDTYVPDLRGRGLSEPRMSRTMTYGMWEAICEDVPALVRAIRERRGRPASVWIAHSW
ncbi:MAG: alpha/beta fold hydrolase, partial [Bdellovibrionota bacterium]